MGDFDTCNLSNKYSCGNAHYMVWVISILIFIYTALMSGIIPADVMVRRWGGANWAAKSKWPCVRCS